MRRGDSNQTAPWCRECRRPLRSGVRTGVEDRIDSTDPDRLTHDGCGGLVTHSLAQHKHSWNRHRNA